MEVLIANMVEFPNEHKVGIIDDVADVSGRLLRPTYPI